MTQITPDAVVFDMDGLLLDTERVYLSGFRAALRTLGLPQDDALFVSLVGTNRQTSRRLLRAGLPDHLTLDAFDDVWDADIAAQFARGIPVKPGVTQLARHLRDSGTPYIIATSTGTDKAHLHLDRAGIGDLFPDVIGGDQVTSGKPAPDIYLAAAARLGLSPAHCAAFEDSPNGVRAAHAAGCRTVQIPDLVAPDADLLSLGHHVAASLLDGARMLGLFPQEMT